MKRRRVRSQAGLAVLDVLLAITIFSLISLIAFQSTEGHRAKGYETQAIADASDVGALITGHSDYLMSAPYPTAVGGPGVVGASFVVQERREAPFSSVVDPVEHFGLKLTHGNELQQWTTSSEAFAFCVSHRSGAWAVYYSTAGRVTDHGRFGGCPEVSLPGGTQPTAPTDEPATPESPAPTDEPATPEPASWEFPSSEEDFVELCSRDWGDAAIIGQFAVVYGTEGDDIIFTGNGSQTVFGLGGNDLICGGNGHDKLYGGMGRDVLYGGNGKDTLHGGGGIDYIYGGNGKDDLSGGGLDGEDDVYGGAGVDHLFGNNGQDSFYIGHAGRDQVYGGNGTSNIYYSDIPDPTP